MHVICGARLNSKNPGEPGFLFDTGLFQILAGTQRFDTLVQRRV
ncbi:hypothetical protein HAP32_04610 [Serratia fonticola]|jgi:hypothetical protein|nr:hypothetical protein HAP32_04610 [Serratia fonticola]